MKRSFTVNAIVFAGVLLTSSSAQAATATGTLGVSATVVGNCAVTSTNLNSGNYDPLVAQATTPLDGSQVLSIYYTRGVAPTSIDLSTGVNPSGAVRRLRDGVTTNYLNYELYKDSARTSIWGVGGISGLVPNASTSVLTPLTAGGNAITVYGRVAAGQGNWTNQSQWRSANS